MITENLSTLKIHKLTQAQYDRELLAGNIDDHAIYLTPDEAITLADLGGMSATNPVGTGSFSMNRLADSTVGNYSVTFGMNNEASGASSFAAGASNHAVGGGSAVFGSGNTINALASFAFGSGNTVNGATSFVGGLSNNLSEGSSFSFVVGSSNNANGSSSFVGGTNNNSLAHQFVYGHYNNTTTATAGNATGAGNGTAFAIGNGTNTASSNAFRIDYNGTPYAKNALTTTGADYAEFFEWKDLNPNAEDRRGYFVTLDGDKIKVAEPNDYILGIISGQPSVIGNGDEDWMGRYVFDEFGAFIYEDFEYEEEVPETVINEKTGESSIITKKVIKTGKRYKENPNYDPSLGYIQREDRPEWDAVGMIGVLSVRDDGTCQVNGYCTVAEGGIATASDSGYRVIKRVNDNIVKVIFR